MAPRKHHLLKNPLFNLTSKSNKLQVTRVPRKKSKIENSRSDEKPLKAASKQFKVVKLSKINSKMIESTVSQNSYRGGTQTTRRESDISAFPPKLCKELLLSKEHLNKSTKSRTKKTPKMTKKKSNCGIGSSSSSFSTFTKKDLKIKSENFNGLSIQEDQGVSVSGKFSYCEMKSSPTIKEMHTDLLAHGIKEYQTELSASTQKKGTLEEYHQIRKDSKASLKSKQKRDIHIFKEYGSDIPEIHQTNQIRQKSSSQKNTTDLVSASSMFENVHPVNQKTYVMQGGKKRKTSK